MLTANPIVTDLFGSEWWYETEDILQLWFIRAHKNVLWVEAS